VAATGVAQRRSHHPLKKKGAPRKFSKTQRGSRAPTKVYPAKEGEANLNVLKPPLRQLQPENPPHERNFSHNLSDPVKPLEELRSNK